MQLHEQKCHLTSTDLNLGWGQLGCTVLVQLSANPNLTECYENFTEVLLNCKKVASFTLHSLATQVSK